jgi:hypothetical protein
MSNKLISFVEYLNKLRNEEAPANNAGSGNVAGMGVNGPSDVKVSRRVNKKRKKKSIFTRADS